MWKKILKGIVLVVSLLAVAFAFLVYQSNQKKMSAAEKVIKFAENELTKKTTYWFEMSNIVNGQWDPVILVFGYYDNSEPCESMLKFARKESPNRSFRCRRVR